MTFNDIVDLTRDKCNQFDISPIKDQFIAIQFDLFGDNDGIFYIELKDGILSVEPYNYFDHNAKIIISADDYLRFIEGKLDATTAFSNHRLKIEGSVEKVLSLTNIFK